MTKQLLVVAKWRLGRWLGGQKTRNSGKLKITLHLSSKCSKSCWSDKTESGSVPIPRKTRCLSRSAPGPRTQLVTASTPASKQRTSRACWMPHCSSAYSCSACPTFPRMFIKISCTWTDETVKQHTKKINLRVRMDFISNFPLQLWGNRANPCHIDFWWQKNPRAADWYKFHSNSTSFQ